MRHITLLITLITTLSLSAQIEKGDWLLSYDTDVSNVANFETTIASTNLNGTIFTELEETTLGFSVSARYALTNRFLVGMETSYFSGFGEGFNADFLQLSPNVRYYVTDTPGADLFVGLALDYSFTSRSDNQLGAGLEVGYQLSLTDNVLFAPVLAYNVGNFSNGVSLGTRFEFNLRPRAEAFVPRGYVKGDYLLGTNLFLANFQRLGTSVTVLPSAYRFLNERTAIGAGVLLGYGRIGDRSNRLLSSFNLAADVRLRRFFGKVSRLRFFGETSVGAGFSTASGSFTTSGIIDGGSRFNLALGLAGGGQYFLREDFALEFGPSFRYLTGELSGTGYFGLSAGIRWVIRR
ncbi:hypothetical protein [Neolewinella antarctica]|uniref:Uncharacterized protein n=1 Tax=Neolewinella antarctica TaxID=442734 RepID=A0ABX0XA23_9BACT|nr:hypothetical protein [Neolewinella antarctica]NJC25804.1 hypothetical protein [Neolewinella antarctica]